MTEVISSILFIIYAFNPGYTVDGVGNIDDFVELRNIGESTQSLTGVELRYNGSRIYSFGDSDMAESGSILLKYRSSPNNTEADGEYSANLAMDKGILELYRGSELLDSICWGSEGCFDNFNKVATKTKSLVRCEDCEQGWEYISGYEPEYGGLSRTSVATPEKPVAQCKNLEFSEILTYYSLDASEQFIELFNYGNTGIDLYGCLLRYKSKNYTLSGYVGAQSYVVLRDFGVTLTKNPTSSNILEILDENGEVVAKLTYYKGQKKDTSYAKVLPQDGDEIAWAITYRPTPGMANIYQEYRSCEAGKVINEDTGNCVKAPVAVEPKTCAEGQFLNPLTNRCKKIVETTTTECKEGYERNPLTNRCRLIRANNGADLPPTPPTYSNRTAFVGLGAVVATVVLCAGYACWQFRKEIGRFAKDIWAKVPLRRQVVQ